MTEPQNIASSRQSHSKGAGIVFPASYEINAMDYKIIYSNRKTLCIKLENNGEVTVRAPFCASRTVIENFVVRHEKWIESHITKIREKQAMLNRLSREDTEALRQAAKEYIPGRVEYYADIMDVNYTGIRITSAKTRFGSCSATSSLCFSLYLMTYPKEAVDAVVVHELAHIRHKNHAKAFYDEVKRAMPDYDERKKLLKNGIL